jgi:hypothetical protein
VIGEIDIPDLWSESDRGPQLRRPCLLLPGASAAQWPPAEADGTRSRGQRREDRFPLEKLVTDRYSLEQIEEARIAWEEGQILG